MVGDEDVEPRGTVGRGGLRAGWTEEDGGVRGTAVASPFNNVPQLKEHSGYPGD